MDCRVILACIVCVIAMCSGSLQATYVYPMEIFSGGAYEGSPEMNIYVVVSDGAGSVDFTFYNESSIESSLARIYFDDGSLFGISAITDGPGTDFVHPTSPGDLPNGNMLVPPFVTTDEFCVGGAPPPPENGVNPVGQGEPLEWVEITFDLVGGATLLDVVDELDSGALRIGAHIISLPDGSSASAVNVPEPATLLLIGFGALIAARKRSKGRFLVKK